MQELFPIIKKKLDTNYFILALFLDKNSSVYINIVTANICNQYMIRYYYVIEIINYFFLLNFLYCFASIKHENITFSFIGNGTNHTVRLM